MARVWSGTTGHCTAPARGTAFPRSRRTSDPPAWRARLSPDDRPSRPEDVPVETTRDIWNRIAGWWDAAIGEGNEFQEQLIMPATDRLLGDVAGRAVLDVACGNGNYARRLARAGASVVGVDFSDAFLDRARARSAGLSIAYQTCDATDETALLSLGAARFDSAVCSMAMMDMPTIDPLLRAVRMLLKPDGRFVFSLPHPCFNSNRARMTAELINEDGQLRQEFGVRITEYVERSADQSSGILNQPEPHYLFHRPLSDVLASCFAAGFVVDGFEEPAFPKGTPAKNAFAWAKRPAIPPAVVVRVR
jgi:SAM-dependent methyltransferase